MDLKTEFENQLSDLQRELFRESDTAYYIGYSEFLEQRLEARQRETLVMWRSVKNKLPTEKDADENGKVLVWREVNADQQSLEKSIYDWSMVRHLKKTSYWQRLPKRPQAT
jgi:hypothetical protein